MKESAVPNRIQPVPRTRMGGRFRAVIPRPAFPWRWAVAVALVIAAVALCLISL